MQEYAYFKHAAEDLEAIRDFDGAYECWRQVLKNMPHDNYQLYYLAMERLACAAYKRGMHGLAATTLIELLMTIRLQSGTSSQLYADLLNKLAWLYFRAGDLDQAETAILEAQSIYSRLLKPDHPMLRAVASNLTKVYDRLNLQPEKASQAVLSANQTNDEPEDWKCFLTFSELSRFCAA